MAFAEGYIPVADRIAEFRAKHPEGSLRPLDPNKPFEIVTMTGVDKHGKETQQTYIVYTAAAYRTPDDPNPGIGTAWEVWPGRTPYTRDSELQNAETSAWGRALVAALAADTNRGIASAEEVYARRPVLLDHGCLIELGKRVDAATTTKELSDLWGEVGTALESDRIDKPAADWLANRIKARGEALKTEEGKAAGDAA